MASRGKPLIPAKPAPIIALDPGHPSERNDGRRVVNGISEVEACWLVAVRVKELLEAEGVRVVMTKSQEGEFVTNRVRAEIANRSRADLFLRLHCDTGTGSGFAVYYPDRKGNALGRKGPDASVIASSRWAAGKFHEALARELKDALRDNGIKGDSQTFVGRKQGALTGSIFSKVPALTLEMCVLDNPADAAFIKSPKGREKLTAGIARAAYAVVRPR